MRGARQPKQLSRATVVKLYRERTEELRAVLAERRALEEKLEAVGRYAGGLRIVVRTLADETRRIPGLRRWRFRWPLILAERVGAMREITEPPRPPARDAAEALEHTIADREAEKVAG